MATVSTQVSVTLNTRNAFNYYSVALVSTSAPACVGAYD